MRADAIPETRKRKGGATRVDVLNRVAAACLADGCLGTSGCPVAVDVGVVDASGRRSGVRDADVVVFPIGLCGLPPGQGQPASEDAVAADLDRRQPRSLRSLGSTTGRSKSTGRGTSSCGSVCWGWRPWRRSPGTVLSRSSTLRCSIVVGLGRAGRPWKVPFDLIWVPCFRAKAPKKWSMSASVPLSKKSANILKTQVRCTGRP
ncbi:hypothetical protein V1523DRAFT_296449 [Lipomyces doorenjongii]